MTALIVAALVKNGVPIDNPVITQALVDQQGRKVSLAAGLQLARDMIAGRAKIIAGSTKPFFERALENIYHTLNERADHLKTEVAS